MGGRKLKWSHRLRECLRAQRHPPFPLLLLFLPSCTDLHLHLLLVREKKTRRRILEHRGIAVVYNESGVNLILTPLYHQDVSHGRGHSRGTQAYVYNPFVVTVTNFREDGPSSRSLIAYYFLSSFSLVCVSFVSPLLFDPEPRLRAMREREREGERTRPAGKVSSRVFDPVHTVRIRDQRRSRNYFIKISLSRATLRPQVCFFEKGFESVSMAIFNWDSIIE